MQEQSRWVGRVLRDKWRIDARIARGGVGTVFAATHKNNGSKVAIKVLHAEFSRDSDTRSRFLQEGYAANQVNHPGVVRILDDDVLEDGSAFLVMELLEGELLEKRRLRKQGKLPLAEVYEIADQLLDVLALAHDKQIVHRDIKPDNLFLTKEGRLKVLDFGFAQMKSGFRKEQTATGFLLGTPGFMSPEQAVGARGQIDAATDIWAVGATLFTLLSGLPVHDGGSAAEMLVAAANFPARSLASVAPELPPRLVSIVDRALAFDKANRWPNARAMQIALRGVPGRQTFGGASFDSGRRSVPDAEPMTFEEKTVAEHAIEIEELDSAEVKSWQTGDRTVMAMNQEIPDEARPSGFPRPHPTDDEGPTLARESPLDTEEPRTAPPMTPPMAPQPRLSGMVHASDDGGTVIMGQNAPPQPYPASGPATSPMGVGVPPPQFAAPVPAAGLPPPPQYMPQDPRRSSPGLPVVAPPGHDMMYVAGPARPALPPANPTGSRVLVFVAVAAVSMVIVILTGLLILAASD
jgi:serine/threonine-protein kinase